MEVNISHFIFMLIVGYPIHVNGSSCKWDILHCDRNEVSCASKESILLNAKNPMNNEQCLAIKDENKGEYKNYQVSVDFLSLESNEGQNSGYLGIIFNFLDQMNYDFLYVRYVIEMIVE